MPELANLKLDRINNFRVLQIRLATIVVKFYMNFLKVLSFNAWMVCLTIMTSLFIVEHKIASLIISSLVSLTPNNNIYASIQTLQSVLTMLWWYTNGNQVSVDNKVAMCNIHCERFLSLISLLTLVTYQNCVLTLIGTFLSMRFVINLGLI